MNLQQLEHLGVKELSVKNHEATAVNPYEKYYKHECDTILHPAWMNIDELPPLPTSGIPDGTVSIEQVEPQEQYCISTEWFPMIWPDAIKSMNYETRTALVLKQEKEEDKLNRFIGSRNGDPLCPKCLGYGHYSVKTTLPSISARRVCDCKQVKEQSL